MRKNFSPETRNAVKSGNPVINARLATATSNRSRRLVAPEELLTDAVQQVFGALIREAAEPREGEATRLSVVFTVKQGSSSESVINLGKRQLPTLEAEVRKLVKKLSGSFAQGALTMDRLPNDQVEFKVDISKGDQALREDPWHPRLAS